MLRRLALSALALLLPSLARAQAPTALSFPPDTSHWELEGHADPTTYQGRPCLHLDGAAAIAKDLEMRDGVIDVDVATPAIRGFFGVQFRVTDEGATSEWVYLRQHETGLPDAIQY